MPFQVSLTYSDDNTVNLVVPDDSIEEVTKAIKEHNESFYVFNEQTKVGVWTQRGQLRHIIVQPYKEPEDEPQKKDRASAEPVSDGDEHPDGGKAASVAA